MPFTLFTLFYYYILAFLEKFIVSYYYSLKFQHITVFKHNVFCVFDFETHTHDQYYEEEMRKSGKNI